MYRVQHRHVISGPASPIAKWGANGAPCKASAFAHPFSSGSVLMLGALSPRRYLWGNWSSGGAVKATGDDLAASKDF
ncbi:uncharacterized protein TrAtP1_008456 [Trichoderma atroviride]|uniref:uncharacterized protein n=1 Tax=Hypocrea atroviridis TaxID=63577 RepID=UPI00333251EB|nr:hypothetical protein TrAtP1_008456 [Trichoderma atroviride]